ncbi:MAG: DUF1858 domain-containing protein [Bacteroidales bacterium]|jgi:hypothetical protein|nr:DUF1858 domain-containing protein [Bacteroidales bacterium]
MDQNKIIISPKTKVLALIEAYPQLEETLIDYVPAFEKLRNPVLRKTVARIATLQQAAVIGNVKVEELINVLRKEVGQDLIAGAAEQEINTVRPGWFDHGLVKQETDIRPMLAAGEQPVNQVMADLNRLEPGVIYRVIAPFVPAPLIEKASSLKIDHWLEQEAAELFHVYFHRTE